MIPEDSKALSRGANAGGWGSFGSGTFAQTGLFGSTGSENRFVPFGDADSNSSVNNEVKNSSPEKTPLFQSINTISDGPGSLGFGFSSGIFGGRTLASSSVDPAATKTRREESGDGSAAQLASNALELESKCQANSDKQAPSTGSSVTAGQWNPSGSHKLEEAIAPKTELAHSIIESHPSTNSSGSNIFLNKNFPSLATNSEGSGLGCFNGQFGNSLLFKNLQSHSISPKEPIVSPQTSEYTSESVLSQPDQPSSKNTGQIKFSLDMKDKVDIAIEEQAERGGTKKDSLMSFNPPVSSDKQAGDNISLQETVSFIGMAQPIKPHASNSHGTQHRDNKNTQVENKIDVAVGVHDDGTTVLQQHIGSSSALLGGKADIFSSGSGIFSDPTSISHNSISCIGGGVEAKNERSQSSGKSQSTKQKTNSASEQDVIKTGTKSAGKRKHNENRNENMACIKNALKAIRLGVDSNILKLADTYKRDILSNVLDNRD